jgi:hypothetical protein
MFKRIILPSDELKELKRKTKARDGNRCRYPKCKSSSQLHSHHIQFRSDMGSDISGNLCTLCSHHHDCVHGKVKDLFIVIVNPDSDLIPPDADVALRFKSYNNVRKRVTWRVPS